ncbi:MAG: serine/threonine protein phosphatase 1 [Myxococcota bacterium]|jgi:serine/threonine protein phosphatase 1
MRRLIIGDIHGCFEELCELVAAAGLTEDDEVISVGDMVDRGPGDAAVLDFFRTRPNARAVMGNHELKHIRWRRGELRPALSQRISRRLLGEAGWQSAVDWMETLPNFIELPEALIVHGFFEPGVPLGEQHHRVLCGTMGGQRRLSAYGDLWFEHYDGDKPLIVGHLLYDEDRPVVRPGRFYGLDTGCCHGMRLTGLLLPEFKIISVPARSNHWAATRETHADLRFVGLNPAALSWEKAESVLAAMRRRTDDADAADKADAIDAVLSAARQAQQALLVRIEVDHAAAVAAVTVDPADDRAYARAYAMVIGTSPLAGLLHARRREQLTMAYLEKKFDRPSAMLKFMKEL